ncbi:MAG: BON domain-containing protein [Lentisphaerota bacterium]
MKTIHLWVVMSMCVAALVAGCVTTQQTTDQPTDKQLFSDVQNRLIDDSVTKLRPFNIEVKEGVVSLRGVVHNETVRARAVSVARGTPGVKDVIDLIEVQ